MEFGFMFYDLVFLVIFIILISTFLIKNKKNVKAEGPLMFLYRTNVGVKWINKIAEKYKKTLNVLSYFIVAIGYLLMGFSIYLVYNLVVVFTKPGMIDVIRIPPLAPLIPYLPEIFKATWLPPFYATYWIVILVVVAIFHEGAHGILARYHKVRIKSTGFGFFWPLLSLLFFVEQDDKDRNKKKIFSQLSIIAAGVFANLILAVIFFFLMVGFFSMAYTPSGVIFNDYSYAAMPVSVVLGGLTLNETLAVDGLNFTKIKINNTQYWIINDFFELNKNLSSDSRVKVYHDLPAIKANIVGAITKINSENVKTKEDISKILNNLKPGNKIQIQTIEESNRKKIVHDYEIVLGAEPANLSRPVLGIISSQLEISGFKGVIYRISNTFKDSTIYYMPKIFDNFTIFIYYLLQWLFLINLSVALANMIPAGIFDGGKFFYLTIFRITGRKKLSERIFKAMTWIFVGILVFLTLFWAKWFVKMLLA